MSDRKIFGVAIATVGFLGCVSFANASSADGYNQSTNANDSKWIKTYNKDKNNADKASFWVDYQSATGNTAANKYVSFERIKEMASHWYVPSSIAKIDNNGVVVGKLYNLVVPLVPMPDHSVLGRISFKQVGNMDVWFGDWENIAPKGQTQTEPKNYSVYYAGVGLTTNMPTSGTATYSIKGINKYSDLNSPIMSGTFTADFEAHTLSGTISKTNLSIDVNANISGNTFAGTATANGSTNGQSEGAFYGDGAAGLAGMATFGGTKN
ncbi:MAG: Slam-dependent surface lipoprotein [Helicobacteraceae bacterium]